MYRTKSAGLALALLVLAARGTAMADPCTSGITSLAAGFNGTPIPAGNTLWFNSVVKPSFPAGVSGPGVTIFLNNATLTLTAKGCIPVVYRVPNAQIAYSPAITTAATSYDSSSQIFVT